MKRLGAALAALVLLSVGCEVHAEWTTVSLNPAEATSSYAGEGFPRPAGSAVFDGVSHAGVWLTSSSQGWLDLHPAEASASEALYSRGTRWVTGYATIDGRKHASYWNAMNQSGSPIWVDLHPSWADESVALGMMPYSEPLTGTESVYSQAGYVTMDGVRKAAVWDARDNSCHLLYGPENSVANSIWRSQLSPWPSVYGGNFIVGSAGLPAADPDGPIVDTACFWVLIEPTYGHWGFGVLSADGIADVDGPSAALSALYDQIAGYITVGGATHASTWSIGQFACTDLNPDGASASMALASANNNTQIGYAEFDGVRRAGYWSGTSESWFDLHSVLDPDVYSYSEAAGGYLNLNGTGVISGWAFNAITGQREAIAWVSTVPEPSSMVALLGGLATMLGIGRRRLSKASGNV